MASLAYRPAPLFPHPLQSFFHIFPLPAPLPDHLQFNILQHQRIMLFMLAFSPVLPPLVFHGFRAFAVYGPFVCFEALGDGSKYANSFL